MLRRFAVVVLLIAVSSAGFAGAALAAPTDLSAAFLTGAKEVPGPGDDNGVGTAVVSPRPGNGTVCVAIRYVLIEPPTAAHIHLGPTTEAGGVVVDLVPLIATSPPGQINGCVAADPALAENIAVNPSDYYVNVHNVPFPGGAIRGQLRG